MSVTAQTAVANWRAAAEQATDRAFAVRQQELESRRAELTSLARRDAAAKARTVEEAEDRLQSIAAFSQRATALGAQLEATSREAATD